MPPRPSIAIVAASLDILGGQGVQAASLADALRADGYDVRLVAINPRFPHRLRGLRRIPYVRTLVNQTLYLPSLAQLAAVDVAHIFSASYTSFLLGPVPAMLAAQLLNKRVVLHYHSGEAEDHLANWGVLVHPWLRLAHEIVVPSAYLGRVFARFGYQARVIPNVVDLDQFRYLERGPLRPRFLSARNLEGLYRVDTIIEAFAVFQAQEPAATLTVAGYGREEERLRKLASALTRGGVRFVGRVEPAMMPRLYADHDVFLNASVIDNQPVSILEAFAAGLPVISTATGDLEAMVRHGQTGLIVPPGDSAALTAAMAMMLGSPATARRMAQQARAELRRHTWPAVREAWSSVYS
jgi:L-malate glycosyltransferase